MATRKAPAKAAKPAAKITKKAPARATRKAQAKRAAPRARAAKKGPNERAVESHLEALRRAQPLDTEAEILGALAVKLGALLDGGEPVTMTVAWARELRLTLAALKPGGAADGDDDGTDSDSWIAGLPSPLRDSAQP